MCLKPFTTVDFIYFYFVEEGETKTICTLPEYEQTNMCRNCTNPLHWRCDSGWCISKTKVRDGVPDCPNDFSDESYGKGELILISLSSVNDVY